MSTAPATELNGLFLHELEAVNEDVRRRAALAAFQKLHPSNQITVEKFLGSLQSHPDVWAVVRSLGVVEFAQAIAGQRADPDELQPPPRRTRINDQQKSSLKSAILRAFESQPSGMSRSEVTAAIIASGFLPQGIDRVVLADKVRQPLHELVAEGQLHTTGEKRLMKYVPGVGTKKAT